MNNESPNRAEPIYANFNPDDVSNWIKDSPVQFMETMIHELKREASFIQGWTSLIHDNPNIREAKIDRFVENRPIQVGEVTSRILMATDIMERLLNTMRAYVETMKQ